MRIISGDKYLHCFGYDGWGWTFSLQEYPLHDTQVDVSYRAETIYADNTFDTMQISIYQLDKYITTLQLYKLLTDTCTFQLIPDRQFHLLQFRTNLIPIKTFQIIDGYVCVNHLGELYKITPVLETRETRITHAQNFHLILYDTEDENALRVEYDDADLDCGLK